MIEQLHFAAAVVGLGATLAYIQINKSRGACSPLLANVFFLWRIAVGVHWWAAAIFVAASFIAGWLNGSFARRSGREGLNAISAASAALGVLSLVVVLITMFLH